MHVSVSVPASVQELLLPVSGLYDFELLLAQTSPLKTHRE